MANLISDRLTILHDGRRADGRGRGRVAVEIVRRRARKREALAGTAAVAKAGSEHASNAFVNLNSIAGSSPRNRFVAAVAGAFNATGVEYAILHGYEEGDHGDTDLDVAVGQRSRHLVDALVRQNMFGRVVQMIHYDIPWCRTYVVEVDEPGRRYRQLDIACDPWGVSRLGAALPMALAETRRLEELRVPAPAGEAVYFAVKKAVEGLKRSDDAAYLRRAFLRDPRGATVLLERHFAGAGTLLARALAAGEGDYRTELSVLRAAVQRQRRTPAALARRIVFVLVRSAGRVLAPTGLVVALAGPDGSGKSTLAAALEANANGLFMRRARLHLRPGVLPSPARLLGRTPPRGAEPHGRAPSGAAGSLARIAYLWLDTIVGWGPRVAVPRVRSGLVILERGWLDLAVDPQRYRLSVSPRIVTALARIAPRADLVLLLDASPELIHARKPELEVDEIERQLRRWRFLGAELSSAVVAVDASRSPVAAADDALDEITNHMSLRQRDLNAFEPALACLGRLEQNATPHAMIASKGRARWILPHRVGARGPQSWGLYRPATRKAPGRLAGSRAGPPGGSERHADGADQPGYRRRAVVGRDARKAQRRARSGRDGRRRSRQARSPGRIRGRRAARRRKGGRGRRPAAATSTTSSGRSGAARCGR